MNKKKAANKGLGIMLAAMMALGVTTNVLPKSANAVEERSGAAGDSFAYACRNVIANSSDDKVKCYEIDATAANKMGTPITNFKGGPHGGTDKLSQLTDGKISSFETLMLSNAEQEGIVGWIVVDAGAEYVVQSLLVDLVHDWGADDLLIQLSVTEDFANPITVYNNDNDDSLGFGDPITADFSSRYTDSIKSGRLMNEAWKGLTLSFAPVTARYIRITHNTVGNGNRQGYTSIGEIQMFAYETAGTAGPASVAPVTFSSAGGTFSEAAKVTLSSADANAEIYYTTDGSVPTDKSTKYTGEIDTAELSNACVIRAAAKVNGTLGLSTHGTFAHAFTGDPENVALNKTVKAYAYDSSAANMMGTEFTQLRTGGDGNTVCSVNEAGIVNGSINNDIIRPVENAEWWAVVDFGQSETIGSVVVSFWRDDKPQSAMIQLSDNANFTGDNVTTIYCNDVKYGALVGAAQNEALPCVADVGYTIKLSTPATGRYLRVIALVREGTMWLNEVKANVYVETPAAPPALQAYVTSVNDAFGEEIALESVANGSTADSITEKLPGTVNLVDSDGKTHSNVSGTWSAPEGFNGSTAGDYTFTFTPDSADGLPADSYGVATAVVTVEAPANLTTLDATLETAAAKQETDYTVSTWHTFAQAKTAAETVKNATLRTQREVDKANADLTAAMTALAARADVTALSAELAKHEDKAQGQYTASTWSVFDKAKTAAAAIVADNSNTDQAQADKIKDELAAAAAALVARADTTELSKTYESAKATYGTEATSSSYTKQTWSDYIQAMATAKSMIDDNSEASQAEADAAKAAIEAAIEGFVEKAAKTDVEALLAEVAKLRADESKYTAASYAEFKPVLSATEDAVGGAEVTKEAFDAAKAAFDAAKAKLVAVGDATELKALIATKVEAQSAYTAASWKTYSEALSAANTAAAGGKSQAEIDAAKTALKSAIDGLVKLGDKTALAELIETAKAEKSIGEALAKAINDAQEVMDDGQATQAEVDEAREALQKALDGNKKGGCGSTIVGAGFAGMFVLAAGACALCLKKKKDGNK